MKTIWEIFVISIIGVLIFSGVGLINEYMFLKGTLDDDSQNMVLKYDNRLSNFISEYNNSYNNIYNSETELNQLEQEADVNTLDSFVKEYGEAKQKVGILREGLDMISSIPDMVFLAIPFVEESDLGLYKQVAFYMVLFIIGIAITVALFQRRVSTN